MIKAVFFDLYNTLARFKPSRYELQSQACESFGIDLTPEGVSNGYAIADAYMSEQNALMPIRLLDQDKKDKFFSEYERLILQGSGVEVSIEQSKKIFQKVREIPYGLAIFDDVIPSINQLHIRGLRLGMISNLNRDGDELAKSLGLDGHLDFIVTSVDVGVEKPDPKIFLEALTRAGVTPQESVHVGDQPISDVDGAIRAGIIPILIDRYNNYIDYETCERIENLLELPSMLDKLQSNFL